MVKPRNPSGTRRAHTRRGKGGKTVHVGRSSIKNRQNRKRRGRNSPGFGTSRKIMSNGKLTRGRKKQVWSRVAWSSTGTASFVFFQQQRYGAAAIFGIFAVGFGIIDLGMTINRKRQERNTRKEKLAKQERQRNRPARKKSNSYRPSAKTRVRNNLETGVVAAAARKPTLDTEYRDAERERREGKERIPVG